MFWGSRMTRNSISAALCGFLLATSLNTQAELVDQNSYLAASEFQLERKEHVWTDGSRYEGEWLKDQPHGYGSLTYANGSQYWGRFEHGRRHGQGMMKYENGDEFEGSWHKDQPQGTGTKRYAAGSVYEGEFKQGQPQGEGKQTYVDGTYYQGHWNKGKPHGYGKLTFISGGVYEGSFKNGRPEGKGRYLYPNEDVYFGQWKNGNQDGQGRIDFATGGYYEGQFVEGMRHGEGVLVSALGHSYSGPFQYNEAHGEGVCRNAGKKEICQYKRNKRVNKTPTLLASAAAVTAVAVPVAKASTSAPKAKATVNKPASKPAKTNSTAKAKPKPKANTVAKTKPVQKPAPIKAKKAAPKKAEPIEFVAKPFQPDTKTAAAPPKSYSVAKTSIPTAASSEQATKTANPQEFKQTLQREKAKVITVADLRQDKSDIYFVENWKEKDLMAIPETAYWQKKASLFSNAMQIISVHGDTEIRLQIDDYAGPGTYTIGKARVASKGNKLNADNIESGSIQIESDENGWVAGTFDLQVNDGNGNALAFNNGVFRLSSKDALPSFYR